MIKKLNNKTELINALELIAKVFYNGKTEKILIPYKYLKPDNFIAIKIKNQIIAVCVIITRELFYNDKLIKASFLSFVCVDESYRGKGLSRKLINFSIDECYNRKSKISIVIARKLVDKYYQKFEFFGVSQYSKTLLLVKNKSKESKYSFNELKKENYKDLNEIYNSIYFSSYGAFKRDEEYWSYIIKKVKSLGFKLKTIILNKELIGYVIYDNENIFEIATTSKINYINILEQMVTENYIDKNLTIHCSSDHPIHLFMEDLDHSISNRQCKFGGHMIKINDHIFFKNTFKSLIKKEIKSLKKLNQLLDTLDNEYDFPLSNLLFNSRSISPNKFHKQLVMKSFNIPLLDQI